MAHAAVHAVAAPLVENAPRALLAVAAEPIHVAFYSSRPPTVRPPRPGADVLRAEPLDPDEPLENDDGADAAPPSRETESDFDQSADHPMVNGSQAILRNGIAYAPSHAPQSVKNAIWAVNTIRHKPYVWGGGHGSFYDNGYDCSGTVSFALHYAGALAAPLPSSDLLRYGERGRGRWITIYSRPGHTFAMVAGLRLDTTDFRYGGNEGPRWHVDMRDTRGFAARHPAGM
jgi:cell wall-associated NlpC family hydrolase